MNPVLPAGLRALESYEGGQKAGKLAWLRARLELEYDAVGADTVLQITELFSKPSILVEKHSKKGDVEMDIAPMIREIHVGAASGRQPEAEADGMQNAKCKMQNEGAVTSHQSPGDEGERILRSAQNDRGDAVVIEAVVAAQNPTLNPLLLVTAILPKS